MFSCDSGTVERPPVIKLGYDDRNLYLGCRFNGADNTAGKPGLSWREDWLHVVFNPASSPDGDGGSDYTIWSYIAQPRPVRHINQAGGLSLAPTKVALGCAKDKDGWTLEVAFPLDELGVDLRKDAVCSFTLARHQGMNGPKEDDKVTLRTATSPDGLERNIKAHGFLVFGQRPSETLRTLRGDWLVATPKGFVIPYSEAEHAQRLAREIRDDLLKCQALLPPDAALEPTPRHAGGSQAGL